MGQPHSPNIERSARRGAVLIRQVLSFARSVEGERVALNACSLTSKAPACGTTVRVILPQAAALNREHGAHLRMNCVVRSAARRKPGVAARASRSAWTL